MKFHLALGALALVSASVLPHAPRNDDHEDLRRFEERFINSQPWALANNTIKLIGYKRIEMNAEERDTLENAIRAEPATWADHELRSNAFYDFTERALRIYFPVRDALLWHSNKLVEANDYGEISHDTVDGDLAVLGRYANDHVHGVETNVIRDGMILLRSPNQVIRKRGNVHVYDFGIRESHDHAKHSKRDGKVSCYKNHGNKICTWLPGCNMDRCAEPSRDHKSCVDYNGWPVKDCEKKRKIGFVGSDCQVALAKGKCWNEIM